MAGRDKSYPMDAALQAGWGDAASHQSFHPQSPSVHVLLSQQVVVDPGSRHWSYSSRHCGVWMLARALGVT